MTSKELKAKYKNISLLQKDINIRAGLRQTKV